MRPAFAPFVTNGNPAGHIHVQHGWSERLSRGLHERRARFLQTDSRFQIHTISTAIAVASPPPMQSEAMPRFRPRFLSACNSVVVMRAPVAPIG